MPEMKYFNVHDELFKYAKLNKRRFIPNIRDLTDKQAYRLLDIAEKADKPWEYNQSWTLDLKQDGLNIILQEITVFNNLYNRDKSQNPIKFYNFYIHYIINPAQIMGDGFYNIYTENNFTEVCNRIDEITASVCNLLPPMQDTRLSRIDFCHDIALDSQDKVDTYLDIIKKYQYYKNFKLLHLPCGGSNRRILPMNSATLKRGATTISIYDKFSEVWKKRGYYPYDGIFTLHNTLRVEVRIYNGKIYYEKKKRRFKDTFDFLNESKRLAQHFFGYYLKSIFGEGDYYSYNTAIDIIEKSHHTPKTKSKLETLIGYISERHSMVGGIKIMLGDGYEPYQIDYMIRQLNELKVNPVTIPRRDKFDYLPNLLQFITEDID
jgi:hypothetical protein